MTIASRLGLPGGNCLNVPDAGTSLTMLICVDPDEAGRWARRAIAAAYLAGLVEVSGLPAQCSLRDGLQAWRQRTPCTSLHLLLVLPSWESSLDAEVRDLLASLQDQPRLCELFVGVVSEDSTPWADLPGIVGHVLARPGQRQQTGLLCWQLLAALGAPGLDAGTDIEDVKPTFGSAAHPARVAQILCDSTTASLMFDDDEHRAHLRQAQAVCLLLPAGPQASPQHRRHALQLLSSQVANDDALVMPLLPRGQCAAPPLPVNWTLATALIR